LIKLLEDDTSLGINVTFGKEAVLSPNGRAFVGRSLYNDTLDYKTSDAAERALASQKDIRALPLILKRVIKNPKRAFVIAEKLKGYMLSGGFDPVLSYLHDRDKDIRIGAIRILGLSNEIKLIGHIKNIQNDPDNDIKVAANAALSCLEDKRCF